MATALNTTDFFDKEEFSDVTINFSGRQIHGHKIILCTNSSYFRKLCGPESHFKESKSDQIELKDDDPDALETILRYIYTSTFKDIKSGDWKYYLEVSKAANKYLLSQLESEAFGLFDRAVDKLSDPVGVLRAMDLIRASEFIRALGTAYDLERRHRSALLRTSEYRSRVESDREMIWRYLDDFNYSSDMVNANIYKCAHCHKTFMSPRSRFMLPYCLFKLDHSKLWPGDEFLGECWISEKQMKE